jgi:hypothetical protein
MPNKPAIAVSREVRMNKTEERYADQLELRRRVGEIREWAFEPENLRLADRTFYAPDFRVILANGEVEMHEVKGYWRDDALVKIKVAASLHPYRFIAVQWKGGDWDMRCF